MNSKRSMADDDFSVQRDDAVCFSAGLPGASFGAGTIHAYLASDRTPPKVVAGISVGALTAAVMERCYREMLESRTEAARWSWLRRYLSYLLDSPYDVAWNAIPNPSDFMADMPPIQDSGLPEDGPEWVRREVMGRRRLHIIALFGRWIAHIPVTVSSVSWILVRFVRFRERYPKLWTARLWNAIALGAGLLWVEWRLLIHIILRPQFFPEWQFRAAGRMISHFPVRPLFGWKLWLSTLFLAAATIAALIWNLSAAAAEIFVERGTHFFHIGLLLGLTCAPLVPVILRRWMKSSNRWGFKKILTHLGIRRSLIDDFHLRVKLFRLFADSGTVPRLKDSRFPVLLVAAPLQTLRSDDRPGQAGSPVQLWPSADSGVSIVDALRTSLAIPRLFAPTVVQGAELSSWLRDRTDVARLDLVDGSTVRHNPLPALFRYLQETQNRTLAESLSAPASRIYLVYDIPIQPKPLPPAAASDPGQEEPRLPNIVETAFASQRLERRRDSRLEVVRTNHISRVERVLRDATGQSTSAGVLTMTVDEIAPEQELVLKNTLLPTETEILEHIAAGCRRTLSVLYRDEIEATSEAGQVVDCGKFLHQIAPRRNWKLADYFGLPGLTEVCRHCPRTLWPAPKPVDDVLPPDFYSSGDGALVRKFPDLAGDRPRIVFLASGGVFRGSFHVGMVGAMLATRLKPDMIVGASVGTLMGAALGAMFSSSSQTAREKLRRLAELFIDVDQRVALTKQLKSAVKDLGIRGRSDSMRLSPDVLRRMVRGGSRKDPGIAVTGAPPALIDAISDLFLLPYRATAAIAAEFVAGHFSHATHAFWKQIRTQTIERLGIDDAVIGSALLEREIRLVLGDTPEDLQPFLESSRIAFFATTVNLVTEWITILGAQLNADRYDLIEALLASSAFPAAFAPRRASALYPGAGRRDIFFGDGGMFDNLPFLPALEVLREVQKDRLNATLGQGRWREELLRRHREPDLVLVGALNVRQGEEAPDSYDSLTKIAARAESLADNEKIYGFERAAGRLNRQIGGLDERPQPGDASIARESEEFLNGIVNAAVVTVYPTDQNHLNGTYEFCASLGMKRGKIRRSIADGCFQTMLGLSLRRAEGPDSMAGRSMAALIQIGRAPNIVARKQRFARNYGHCPYFEIHAPDGVQAIPCPFEATQGIYRTCCEDPVHVQSQVAAN